MSGIPPFGASVAPNWNGPFCPPAISGGYSINVTALQTPSGLPIAALVLKRRRKRRRNRGARHEAGEQQARNDPNGDLPHFLTPIAPNQRRKTRFHSVGHRRTNMSAERACVSPSMNVPAGAGGSCPDLSEQQMQQWDEILFRAVQNERDALEHKAELLTKARRRTTHSAMPAEEAARARSNTPMRTSIYEICAPVDEETGGETNDLNGNHAPLPESPQSKGVEFVTKEEEDREEARSTASSLESPPESQTATQRLAEKLRRELEDLQFRHTHEWQRADGSFIKGMTNPLYDDDFPQDEFVPSHLTTFDSNRRTFATTPFANGHQAEEEEANDRDQFNPQFFAGMTVRVNPFEGDNEMELTEADCPPPSRFQMLQYAIQRQKAKYDEQLQTPQRVCCSLM